MSSAIDKTLSVQSGPKIHWVFVIILSNIERFLFFHWDPQQQIYNKVVIITCIIDYSLRIPACFTTLWNIIISVWELIFTRYNKKSMVAKLLWCGGIFSIKIIAEYSNEIFRKSVAICSCSATCCELQVTVTETDQAWIYGNYTCVAENVHGIGDISIMLERASKKCQWTTRNDKVTYFWLSIEWSEYR